MICNFLFCTPLSLNTVLYLLYKVNEDIFFYFQSILDLRNSFFPWGFENGIPFYYEKSSSVAFLCSLVSVSSMEISLFKLSVPNGVHFAKLYFQNRLISPFFFFFNALSLWSRKISYLNILKNIYSIYPSYICMISMPRPSLNQIFILEYDVRKGSIFSFLEKRQSLSQ